MLLLKKNAIEIRGTDYFASFMDEKVCGMQDIPGQIHGIKGQFNINLNKCQILHTLWSLSLGKQRNQS